MAAWIVLLGVLLWRQASGAPQPQDGGPTRAENAFCKPEWHPFGKKCYRIWGLEESEKLGWENAGKECAKHGGQLATVHSQELQEYLTAFLLLEAAAPVWIGLHDRANESAYEWQDGAAMDYVNWGEGEPSGPKDEKEDCVEMLFFSRTAAAGSWNDVDCDWKFPYLCQVDRKATQPEAADPRLCADGGWRLRGSCFRVHEAVAGWGWHEAEDWCVAHGGGHLAAVGDWTVKAFLQHVFRLHRGERFWIGLSIGEAPQRWLSGWLVSPLQLAAHNLTDLPRGSCIAMAQDGRWKADSCRTALPFVCETSSNTETPPALNAPPDHEFHCPENYPHWFDFGGENCYFFQLEHSINWYEANFRCMRRGGSLAIFHSEEEVTVIAQLFKYTSYILHIGLYRPLDTENAFLWTDGSENGFSLWDKYEPNSREESCTEMRADTGRWNDIDCGALRNHVCSVRKIPPNRTVDGNEHSKQDTCRHGLTAAEAVGLLLCAALVVALFGGVVYHFRRQEASPDAKGGAAAKSGQRYRSGEIIVREDADYDNQSISSTAAVIGGRQ